MLQPKNLLGRKVVETAEVVEVVEEVVKSAVDSQVEADLDMIAKWIDNHLLPCKVIGWSLRSLIFRNCSNYRPIIRPPRILCGLVIWINTMKPMIELIPKMLNLYKELKTKSFIMSLHKMIR